MEKDIANKRKQQAGPTNANQPMHSGMVVATNVIAASVLESLKAGLVIKGTVRSYAAAADASGTAWIAIELPGVGSRDVAVHVAVWSEQRLEAGQQLELQCIPNPLNPGRFMFRIHSEGTAA